jgi:hypothetical protein
VAGSTRWARFVQSRIDALDNGVVAAFANRVDKNRSVVREWTRGVRPQLKTIPALAKPMQVSLVDLFDATGFFPPGAFDDLGAGGPWRLTDTDLIMELVSREPDIARRLAAESNGEPPKPEDDADGNAEPGTDPGKPLPGHGRRGRRPTGETRPPAVSDPDEDPEDPPNGQQP